MATAAVSAAFSVVGKALAPLTDGLLKNWAASVELGDNVEALERELLLVKALLEPTLGREIDNSALKQLLAQLQDLGYDAEDVLDEMDYFRIQDKLDGTFHAADEHAKGCICNLALNLHHTAKAVGKQINCFHSCFSTSATTPGAKSSRRVNWCKAKVTSKSHCMPIHAVGKCFTCSSLPSDPDNGNDHSDTVDYGMDNYSPQRNLITNNEPPKLRFNRVDASKRMQDIVKQLQPLRQDVSSIITTLGSNWSTVPNIAQSRPITTSESVEKKLYGRELMMKSIIYEITKGKHSGQALTVIPIVGAGGIGKTTLAQHIYHSGEVQQHFDAKVWTCVSLNFNVNKLLTEIKTLIFDGESNKTASELIVERLNNKRLLLVLDDIWDCNNEDEWKKLLLPFEKSQVQGNIIVVTTRFPAQAQIMDPKNDHSIRLQGLENTEFQQLFQKIIFGDDDKSRKDHTILLETGFRIASRLKGSPLAAKTVGRLLKTKLELAHWTSILESKEWEHVTGPDDIMPGLKLSFDHLPSWLQQCFPFCALFPQDHKFETEELINFWIGQEVLHSPLGENKRVEDIGLSHLTELVNYGFLENKGGTDGRTYYIIHDLLHELAQKISSIECLRIDNSQSEVSSLEVLPSIRHLSINIATAKDRLTLKNDVQDFNTVGTRLKVEKLRTLMIFGEHHGCFLKAFGDLFREAKSLRLVFLSGASYDVKDLLHNFYYLIHLRYLRIESSSLYAVTFPEKISRFYHIKVLDAKHCTIKDLPRDVSNLVKLRHLLVQDDTIHSSITEVGKLKSLQELRRFVVKQNDQGFELRQIGYLKELHGSLRIDSLQNVQVPEEADEAKLMQKTRLRELILHWGNIGQSINVSTLGDHVLKRLEPRSNLEKLSIIGHRGGTCPSWLGMDLSLSSLQSLCLDDVNWKTFPPIGDLWLVNVPGKEISIKNSEKRFINLRRLVLVHLSGLEKWVVQAPCQLFPYLEVLIIKDCSQLVELSLSHFVCCQQEKDANGNLFSRLLELKIKRCPQLSSFPPVPWTEAPCSIQISGTSSLENLHCNKENEYSLFIHGKKDTNDSSVWNVLAFDNLTRLEELRMFQCGSLRLHHLERLSSLRTLDMSCSVLPFDEADNHVQYQFPVELLFIKEWNASVMELTRLLTYFPKLSDLRLFKCKKVTGLTVNAKGQLAEETPGPSSSPASINKVPERGLLILPPKLQRLSINYCPELSLLHSNPHDDNNKEAGLQGLTSLRQLSIMGCPKLLSSYSSLSFSSSFPFPTNSLKHLTSLTNLTLFGCGGSGGEGLLSLLLQGHLTKLQVYEMPYFFNDSGPPQVHEQEISSCSSTLQELDIDDVAGFTAASIRRSLIFSSLTTLEINDDNKLERFTEQQGTLLFVNSLEVIIFYGCSNLQALPERLHGLHNLKRLEIWCCGEFQMLPSLPSSLEVLVIISCPKIQSLHKDCLPDSLQKLEIEECPAIRSLPEVDDLPRSLRKLYVRSLDNNKELTSQCRRFINNIPIVRV